MTSCNEPDTIVTNIVNTDGSVTRRVEMRSSSQEFPPEDYKVPVDSTWETERSIEVSDAGDTTWILIAGKTFAGIDMINSAYNESVDVNADFSRSVTFSRRFRWFNTVYRFSERVERFLPYGFPLSKYVTGKELEFLLLPDEVMDARLKGPDSLYYRAINDTAQNLGECWKLRGLADGWMKLTVLKLDEAGIDDDFMNQFPGFGSIIAECTGLPEFDFDEVLLSLFGEEKIRLYGEIFDAAADSISADHEACASFNNYTVRVEMPGILSGSNGFVTDDGLAAWPVKSEMFMFEDYEMWAESHIPHRWAWVITVLVLVVVPLIITVRGRKR
jgi:hypothetical protein